MVTVINKTKSIQVYNLSCAIPLKDSKAKDVVIEKKVKKDKVFVKETEKKKFKSKPTERVLTLLPGEIRKDLPDAIVHSIEIANAVKAKQILIKEQKPAVVPDKKGAKDVKAAPIENNQRKNSHNASSSKA